MLFRPSLRSVRPLYRPSFVSTRNLSRSTPFAARKDAAGKDDLKPEGNEYSKSASDAEAAQIDDAAFSRDKTTPEEQLDAAESERGTGNPLNASPANHEISQPRKGTEGGPESSSAQSGQGPSDRQRSSGGSTTEGSKSYKGSKGKKYD
ncbi:hypothetical protein BDZ85DRAFT_281088 [Elsinoe ampelina]|uniref:Uncharacterized protein n=1 Tax=Elsinoe ampelina TaxID=302913 RepID=A0A6A6GFJ6_9PEZI|nr:hypothetical protein BDZ85DRAFT_281088 [Elsinoe ampelina]